VIARNAALPLQRKQMRRKAHNKGMLHLSDADYLARLKSKCTPQADGCWLWNGSTITDGYGQMSYRGKYERIHRLMFSLVNGPIPAGMVVMHSCDVRHCINPAHLSLGTQKDNIGDAIKKRRPHRGTLMLSKTHCPAGHLYEETQHFTKKGHRACTTCQRIAGRRRAGWPEALLELPPQKLGFRPFDNSYRAKQKATASQNEVSK